MTPEEFRTLCNKIGFEVENTVDPSEIEGDGRVPLMGTNSKGDTIYYRQALNGDSWVLDIEPDGYSLDSNGFDPDRVSISNGTLTIHNISGSRGRNKHFQDATLEMSSDSTKVTETI